VNRHLHLYFLFPPLMSFSFPLLSINYPMTKRGKGRGTLMWRRTKGVRGKGRGRWWVSQREVLLGLNPSSKPSPYLSWNGFMLNLESQVLMKVELVKLVIVWLRKFNATSELASFNFGERFLNPYLTIILNTKNWPTLGEYLVWRVRITSFNSN
jgi:hypothetical protein